MRCLWNPKGGFLIIAPFNPLKKMQQWCVVGQKIVNRHDLNLVLEVCGEDDAPGSLVATSQYVSNERQHWEINHV